MEMTQGFMIFINMVIAISDYAVLIYAMYQFLNKTGRNLYLHKGYYILGFSLYMAALLFSSVIRSDLYGCLMLTVSPVALGYFLFNRTGQHIIYNLVYGCSIIAVQIFSIVAFQWYAAKTGNFLSSAIVYSCALMTFKQLMELLNLKLFVWIFGRRKEGTVRWQQILNSFILPVFSVIFLLSMSAYVALLPTEEGIITLIVNLICILLLNIYVSYIFDNIVKKNELENELNLTRQKETMQYRYYEELEKKYLKTRKVVHDMRNHLIAIEQLYQEKDGSGAAYMQDMHRMLNELGQNYYTENRVLNIILNDKAQLAESQGIALEIRAAGTDLTFMKEMDITTVFANLMDNALEAASEAVEKWVAFKMDQIRDFVVINIRNAAADPPVSRNGRFISSKDGKEGIGLQNVKRTVQAYDGTLTFHYEDGVFEVNLMIPV